MQFVETINDPEALAAQQAADNEFYACALREIVALGLDMIRIIHQQVVAQAIDRPHCPIDDQSPAQYDRVFRAVRRGVLLAKKLYEPAKPARAETAAPSKPTRRDQPDQIDTQPRDRLDSPEDVEQLEDRPTAEILEDLRKELGLQPENIARIAPSRCGSTQDQTTETQENRTPIAPSRSGNTSQDTANRTQAEGPPYPPGS